MERTITYQITDEQAGLSVLSFLKQKNYSHAVTVLLKKTARGILVNNDWAYVNQMLQPGDILSVRLMEEAADEKIKPYAFPLSIVYEDDDMLVVDKPAHMPIHPSAGNYERTLANAVLWHAMQKNERYPYRCINRLDRDTTGLTIIAKHPYSSCCLYGQMQNREIRRTYYAITDGAPSPRCGTVCAPIARRTDTIIERTVDFAHGERAVTHYQTLAVQGSAALLACTLETGRTHQIRVHMRYLGHPLLGDFLYHPSDKRMARQALHAGRLSLLHPVTGEALVFTAPFPAEMRRLFPKIEEPPDIIF